MIAKIHDLLSETPKISKANITTKSIAIGITKKSRVAYLCIDVVVPMDTDLPKRFFDGFCIFTSIVSPFEHIADIAHPLHSSAEAAMLTMMESAFTLVIVPLCSTVAFIILEI